MAAMLVGATSVFSILRARSVPVNNIRNPTCAIVSSRLMRVQPWLLSPPRLAQSSPPGSRSCSHGYHRLHEPRYRHDLSERAIVGIVRHDEVRLRPHRQDEAVESGFGELLAVTPIIPSRLPAVLSVEAGAVARQPAVGIFIVALAVGGGRRRARWPHRRRSRRIPSRWPCRAGRRSRGSDALDENDRRHRRTTPLRTVGEGAAGPAIR
jgi:hypothetical protein